MLHQSDLPHVQRIGQPTQLVESERDQLSVQKQKQGVGLE